jgi:2,3-bisphosphoglycerate-dependent phosphoglycerate mutase
MQLYFIRHAQSENNQHFIETGSMIGRIPDPDLTPTGRQQARVLADFLRKYHPNHQSRPHGHDPQNLSGYDFTHLYCSLMVRSVVTGTELARALDLRLVGWPDLHESGGMYDLDPETGERVGLPGLSRADFRHHYPDLVLPESVDENGWWNRPHEAIEERRLRARRFLRNLLERHGDSGDRVAVISHGGFYNHLLRAVLGLPEADRLWFTINNTAITRIDFEGEQTWVSYMNRLDFMPEELIT